MITNIIDFPTELLEKIFEYLEKVNDRRRLAQVCWTFYHVVRHQSTSRCVLKLHQADLEHSPISVFENSTSFPFSKLYIASATYLSPDHHFWQQNGTQIVEITIENDGRNMYQFLATWSAYFPNLRKLRIVYGRNWNAVNVHQIPHQSLTVEELRIETDSYDLCTIRRLQHITHSLKRLHLAVGDAEMVPDLLEWIERVDEVTVNAEKVPLRAIATKLALLPSKVVFTTLFVETDASSGPWILEEFFEKPRPVETLDVEWHNILVETLRHGCYARHEYRPNPLEDAQILSLQKVKSVRYLRTVLGYRMDSLAQLPGLETIEIRLPRGYDEPPFTSGFWTARSFAAKVRSFEHNPWMPIDLDGLSELTSFTLQGGGYVFSKVEEIMQALVRSCPNLKTLQLLELKLNESDVLSIASLKHLEKLVLDSKTGITAQSFKTAFVFPKLRHFEMKSSALNCETLDHLATNCPNLKYLVLSGATIDNDSLQRLVRRLPYLMVIRIRSRVHSVTDEMIRKLKLEFPYLKIDILAP